jgi:hypothetical protein
MAFVKRVIEVTFELGSGGTFNASGDNAVTLTGHRVRAQVQALASPSSGTANIQVFGLTPAILNKLAALDGASAISKSNKVTLKAGDEGSSLATVFIGQIVLSQADMSQQPATCLNIMAQPGALPSATTIPPSSYPGSADAAVIMQSLAAQMGLAFENNGASKILNKPYFWGDAKKQASDCARAAGFEWTIDNGVLAIWPKGATRGGSIPLVSTDSGMIGYPSYVAMTDYSGLMVRTIFDPRLRSGGVVQVKSTLPYATGKWGIFDIQHDLESEVPGGQWFTTFKARSYG